MVEKNALEAYLAGYQLAYSNRAEKMAEKMAAERGVNCILYRENSLDWILASEKIQEEILYALKNEIQQ